MLEILNRYIHGYVAIPVILACRQNNIFSLLEKHSALSLYELTEYTQANAGHLQVALRMLESLDWLKKTDNHLYSVNLTSEEYHNICAIPHTIMELYQIPIDALLIKSRHRKILQKWLKYINDLSDIPSILLMDFLQGVVIVPLMLALKKSAGLSVATYLAQLPVVLRGHVEHLFLQKNWITRIDENITLTSSGQFMLERAFNAAVAASHAPMLYQMQKVLFGNSKKVFRKNIMGHELHLNRALNVLGSGFQHARYFDDIEQIIIEIFNKKPYEKQPKYIIDTGCGNGAFLKKIYEIIHSHTERGQVLEQYPLCMVGIDYNKKSLIATRKTLQHIPHVAMHGDIGNPKKIMDDLAKSGLSDIENSLHIRSFLDHDRPYISPQNKYEIEKRSVVPYQGVFVDREGQLISSAEIIQSLVEHLSRWSSVIEQHGLLILEVHCLSIALIKNYLDQNESLHFDALQAFTQQYLVDASVFLLSAAEAGLFPKLGCSRRYPNAFPYTRISLNYFEKKPYCLKMATMGDILPLLALEQACWPAQLNLTELEIAKRITQFPEGQLILKLQDRIIGVIYTQRIRDVDQLKSATFSALSQLHDREGSILQLLSINIAPDMQGTGIGDQLVEFVLWWASVMNGIKKIVGVTRCKNYAAHSHLSLEEYVQKHGASETGIDSILRFHTNRGAQITAILPHFRPADLDNQGAGILIEYSVYTHSNAKKKSVPPLENKITTKNTIDATIQQIVTQCITELLPEKFHTEFSIQYPLKEMGFDSLRLLELRTLLCQRLNIELESTFFFEYSTSEAIIKKLSERDITIALSSTEENQSKDFLEPIAIIGMSCRFPGNIRCPKDFWELLKNSRCAITSVPIERKKLLKESLSFGGFLSDVDCFDAHFFRISPREASLMDPQQRFLLELAWEALESASINAQHLAGSQTGVFVGIFSNDYETLANQSLPLNELDAHFATGNSTSIAAGRLSYALGLQGPAMAINTACSSSLVAVHLACQSIRQGECELALAAGVNLILSPHLNIAFTHAGMLSPDGLCKTFDEKANGYGRSEGCGVVVLKKLSAAQRDCDNVLAIIRCSAVNQDGASNGLTAPNKAAQEKLFQTALTESHITPESISYIEAHGTGTILGDPIEVASITSVYGHASRTTPLMLGSVKTNLGHTEAAAGMAGLIKTVLMLQEKEIPANLHFEQLNSHIKLTNQINIPTTLTPWYVAQKEKRRAAVNSFGFSGTNAHVILEEAPSQKKNTPEKNLTRYLFTLSAKTDSALQQRINDLLYWLEEENGQTIELAAISYTLNMGRAHFEKRYAVVVDSYAELLHALKNPIFPTLDPSATGVISDDIYQHLPQLADYYMQGGKIDWDRFYSGRIQHKINLPTYPFSKDKYWLPNTSKVQLLDTYSVTHHGLQASKIFSSDLFYFSEHRVQNQRTLPAVVSLEMAFEAGSVFLPSEGITVLTNISWTKPISLSENSVCEAAIHLQYNGEAALFSVSVDAVLHMQGTLHFSPAKQISIEKFAISSIRMECQKIVEKQALYQHFLSIGLNYGTRFQVLKSIRIGQKQALAELQFDLLSDNYVLHPVILDGALQAALQLLDVLQENHSLKIPFSIARIDILHPSKINTASYVYVQATSAERLQVFLLDEEGLVCLAMHDVYIKKISASNNKINYLPRWTEKPAVENSAAQISQNILIVAHPDSLALQNELIIKCSPATIKIILLTDHTEDFFQQKLSDVSQIDELYFIAGVTESTQHDIQRKIEDAKNNGVLALFNLIKALNKLQLITKIQNFHIITLNSQAVLSGEKTPPFFAGLLGLTHSIAREYPAKHVNCLDVSATEISPQLVNQIRAEGAHRHAECVALRAGRRYQRILHSIEFADPATFSPFRQLGVYLIVGGGSGIGFELSRYLAREFHARLVWVSRSPREKYSENISVITALGGEVYYCQAKVNDLSAMQHVIKSTREKWGVIHGAVHSALSLNDKTIVNMSRDDFELGLSPKMQGSAILYAVLQNEPLDFMLFFSSILSFMGNAGQSNYLSGCTFQDAWVDYLATTSSFPVKNINWGYWGEVGSVATPEYRARMALLGLDSIEINEGLAAISQVLSYPVTQLLVAKANHALLSSIGFDDSMRMVCHRPDFPSCILSTLSHAKSFIHSVAPVLKGEEDLHIFALALLRYILQNMNLTQSHVLPKYERLVKVLFEILEQSHDKTEIALDDLVTLKNNLCKTHPHLTGHITLLWACLMAYPDVLMGKRSHMEVMFPDGSLALVEGIYQGNPVADYYNHAVAAVIDSYVSAQRDKEISILEIGSGTGGTSAIVLEKLAASGSRVRFFYTDISVGFVKFGEEHWRNALPNITFQKLDIEQDPIKQGFVAHSMDIVYASNVCHATRNIYKTVQHVKQLLKTHGLFILNEIVQRSDFATLTFGMTDGWWLFEDHERIPGSPLLSMTSWQKVLSRTGFKQAQAFTHAENNQAIIVAESDGLIIYEQTSLPLSSTANSQVEIDKTPIFSNADEVQQFLKKIFSSVLKTTVSSIESDKTFDNYGVDSLITLEINKKLSDIFGPLRASLLFEFMTIKKLANYFIEHHSVSLNKMLNVTDSNEAVKTALTINKARNKKEIAIIGCTGLYPQAPHLQAFWELLEQGKNAIQEIPATRWDWREFFDSTVGTPGKSYSKWGGFIEDVDKFDPRFFNISPAEAERMDPQERIFLQLVWALFEDAGYTPMMLEKIADRTGVFVGVMNHDYSLYSVRSAYWSIANRISYYFGLQGPSLAIDTACSSSLAALHLAYRSIYDGECELAIAGGVNLILHPDHFIQLSQLRMLSQGNTCHSFGEKADGFVVGEGAGVVLLKPLEKALSDGDRIAGIIKGTAMNSGGKTSGYMVPNPNAQAALIETALAQAEVPAESIRYIEAHGTGTSLGDPIEISGLNRVFSQRECRVGSVKSNIGHLESAAGIAAVTKVLLQFQHKKYVSSLHAEPLNPHLDLNHSVIHIQKELNDWPACDEFPRRAGVSSFGAGGTNVHIILEEAPSSSLHISLEQPAYLVLLSAKNTASLKQRIEDLIEYLKKTPVRLENISYTLHDRRQHFDWRLAMVVSSMEELRETLLAITNGSARENYVANKNKLLKQEESVFDEDYQKTINECRENPSQYRQKLLSLADLYIKGYEIKSEWLYPESLSIAIGLPTYPFLKERYWIELENNQENFSLSDVEIKTIAEKICYMLSRILKIKLSDLSFDSPLSEYGIDSIGMTTLINNVNEQYELNLTPAVLFEHQTIKSFAKFIENKITKNSSYEIPVKKAIQKKLINNKNEVAIIGMSGIFPDASNINEFWNNLINHHDAIREIPADRWDWKAYFGDPLLQENKTHIKWGGFVENIDAFDAAFFNISPREAELIDPQQRIFLQTVWHAIEDAGYAPDTLHKIKTGVFVGAVNDDYAELLLKNDITDAFITTGKTRSMIANRVSYFLNLQGPSMTVDTACSSSLVAIHHAIQAIHSGDCEIAIAGGVNALLSPSSYLAASKANMLSSDGRCKTFDKEANGYVRAEGAAALLLKPLALAQAAGDHIYGIIKGSAVNHGGHVNSLTAPNPLAQAEVISTALQKADVPIESITYVETHGTGTALGDPIEINGLKKAFSSSVGTHFCGLGSVKTHVGHLESAAGMASLIKVLLAMQHKKLPGNLHFSTLNPFIELDNSPFYLVQDTRPWQKIKNAAGQELPYRAGISAFGFGGVNAHLIVEEGTNKLETNYPNNKPYYLVTLSAKSEDQLKQQITHLQEWLKQHSEFDNLAALSYTLNCGRTHCKLRCAFIVNSITELIHGLNVSQENEKLEHYLMTTVPYPDTSGPIFQEIYKTIAQALAAHAVIPLKEYRDKLILFADLYVKNFPVDFNIVHQDEKPARIAGLPVYPFSKERFWFNKNNPKLSSDNNKKIEKINISSDLNVVTQEYLKNIFGEKLKIIPEKIDLYETYEVYGVESMMVLDITQRLEADLGSLPKTLLYEKRCINDLSHYLIQKYAPRLQKIFNLTITSMAETISSDLPIIPSSNTMMDIAIIGLSGVYPMADNLQEFWKNLEKGRDCISTIPSDRWNYQDYPVMLGDEKKYYQYGGFLHDIDKFDPLFFNISPRDAALMDPQERLFLQTAWATLEDAGYTRARIQQTVNNQVGVFVGVTYNFYPLFIAEEWQKDNRIPLDIQLFSIANRVSYFMNFSGPSFITDTACSSSLTAIHLASESIRQGECQMALAGGVNLSLHPCKYHALGSYSFLSDSGRCTSFGANGTGYVPGEGVGAVLLKPLDLAIKDGDRIYGVIKSSSINHGGKTSGYTVPNPSAQAALIKTALQKAKINPRDLSYIEAHGTGTSLGDPIEIRGLQEAFETFTSDKQFCAIGSVKSNIGHLESAAGISQLTKVLLQMHHKKLVPSLHSAELNPYINFEDTPFYVQQALTDWPSSSQQPRRAGISSFGAGGTNVHLIVEEYLQERVTANTQQSVLLFVLSAINVERLCEYIKTVIQFLLIEKEKYLSETAMQQWLQNLCFTSQIGREAMLARCAIVATSCDDLLTKLQTAQKNQSAHQVWINDATKENKIITDVTSFSHEQLAEQWVKGAKISWNLLYQQCPGNITSFPTYPFAKRRCWITSATDVSLPSPIHEENTEILSESDWLYTTQWILQIKQKIASSIQEDSHWLIFSDDELGLHLKNFLGKGSCIYCFSGENFSKINESAFYINENQIQDYETVFSQQKKLTGVIVLSTFFTKRDNSQALLKLLQAAGKQTWPDLLKLCFITRGSQAVNPNDTIDYWQYPLWSLMRIFVSENPRYHLLLLDLSSHKRLTMDARAIIQEIESLDIHDNHIALRDDGRYAMRLSHYEVQSEKSEPAPETVLMTGGLGALGSEVALFLAKQGTQHFLLTGTTILPDRKNWDGVTDVALKEKISQLIALEKIASSVDYVALDITDQKQMQDLILQTEKNWKKPIQGVFHLAGIATDNIPIADMTENLWQKVLAAKMHGALLLHEIFQHHSLSHFVLFSSVSALPFFGIGGLSAYAVANAFLHGLALHRRQLGLTAMSVAWSAFAEKGMSFKHNHTAFLDAIGMSALPLTTGMSIMWRLMSAQPATIAVFKVYWEKFLGLNHDARESAFFSHFLVDRVVQQKTVTFINSEHAVQQLITILANLLCLEESELDIHTPLQNYGMDSIIAIHFISKLDEHYPAIVSPMDLYRYPTIEKLVSFIEKSCQSTSSIEPVMNEKKLLDELHHLDEGQIKKLIEAELADL